MESRNSKRILLSCAIVLVISCVIFCLFLTIVIGVSAIWPIDFSSIDSSLFPFEDPALLVDPDINEHLSPDQNLSEQMTEILNKIEQQVSNIRGLMLNVPIEQTLISAEELNEIVVNEFFSEYSDQDARNDVLVLSLLGLLPETYDLIGLYRDLYSEQIAGFYDTDEQKIYVVQGISFGGSEKLTYAHEFTHVLQDQAFNFDEEMNYNEDACSEDSERCAAIKALIEGDATFTELQWFQNYATRQDYRDLMDAIDAYESPILDTAPPFIAEDLYFPYQKGLVFVEYLYDEGGYDAIDQAYLNPPGSTTEILHPELYPDHSPIIVSLPDLENMLDPGWYLYDQNIMGEWYIYLILAQGYEEQHRLQDSEAELAASGWYGDAYAFYLNEDSDEVIFLLDTYWETSMDAEEFMDAFMDYADLRWSESGVHTSGFPLWSGSEGTVLMVLDGNRTRWMIAPSENKIDMIIPLFE